MMETVVSTAAATKHHPQQYSPHLKKVLKTYQLSALKSLSGPSTVLASEEANAKIENGKGLFLSSPSPPTQIKKEMILVNTGVASVAAAEPERTEVKNIENDSFLTQAPFPIQQQPILTTPDQSKSDRSETVLEGETISCFVVGGERRLCLPQILNTVLSDFTLAEINKQCDRLQIFCSRCNPKQLEVLKVSGVLPMTAPSCGLITQTDAERLCSALLHSNAPKAPLNKSNPGFLSFRVYHECFGKCHGIITPALYTDKHSRCIECAECRGLFSPQHFVCHVHRNPENQTCHWGFDSTNWRSYILLTEGQSNPDILSTALRDFKDRHVKNSLNPLIGSSKRKQTEAPLLTEVKEEPGTTTTGKRPRLHDQQEAAAVAHFNAAAAAAASYHLYEPYLYASYYHDPWGHMPTAAAAAAFRPWRPPTTYSKEAVAPKGLLPSTVASLRDSLPSSQPPHFLSQGPPVLLHPERVVPLSESERFVRQPNVALAPATQQLRPPSRPEVKKEVEDEVEEVAVAVGAVLPSSEDRKSLPEPSKTQQPKAPAASTPHPSSAPQPAYNPEIELSSDTEEDSSSERGGEAEELLERLARCVATCSDQADMRLQGETALRTLGVDLLASREARNLLAAENQLLREKVVLLEDRLKTTTSHHTKELEALEERLVISDRQRCELERELTRSREGSERGRSCSRESSATPCSPATSVITSATAAVISPPPNIKTEPAEPPEPAE